MLLAGEENPSGQLSQISAAAALSWIFHVRPHPLPVVISSEVNIIITNRFFVVN